MSIFNNNNPLIQTAKKVADNIAVQAVQYGTAKMKNDVIFAKEKELASIKPLLQQKTNEILGTETIVSSNSTPKKNIATKVLLLESQLMQQALQVPTAATLTPNWIRQQTDQYYKDVKTLSDSKKQTIDKLDTTQETIIQDYYDKLIGLAVQYQKEIEKDGNQNKELIQTYYKDIREIAEENHGFVYNNGYQKVVNTTIAQTAIYYGTVRSLSLLFQTWIRADEKKGVLKTKMYYASLKNYEGFRKYSIDGKEYWNSNPSNNFDTSGEKSEAMRRETNSQEKKLYKISDDSLSKNMWEGDTEYKNYKNKNYSYEKLVAYIQETLLKYYDGTIKIKGDNKENLPERLDNIQKEEQKKWEQYHSHDEMSKEMKASLLALMQSKGVDTGSLGSAPSAREIKDAVAGAIANGTELFTPDSSEVGMTFGPAKNLLEETDYTVKSEGSRKEQVIKKGLTVITSDGLKKQSFVTSPQKPYSSYMAEIIKEGKTEAAGAYRFFFEKLHGKKADGSGFYKRNPIESGKKFADMENRMVFPAYIDNFNDAYDVSWNNYDFYGRSESVWVYKTTTRSLTLNFFMLSDFSADVLIERIKRTNQTNPIALNATSDEVIKSLNDFFIDWGNGSYDLPQVVEAENKNYQLLGWVPGQYSGTSEQMWARMTFLAQCCYPWYRRDGKLKEQPLVRVRIGDFLDVIIKIKSLTFDEYEEFNIDLNPSSRVGAYPMGVRVALTADIIHAEEPHSNYPKFYWRKDFDNEPAPEVKIEPTPTPTPAPTPEPLLPMEIPQEQPKFDRTQGWGTGGNYELGGQSEQYYKDLLKGQPITVQASDKWKKILNDGDKAKEEAKKNL